MKRIKLYITDKKFRLKHIAFGFFFASEGDIPKFPYLKLSFQNEAYGIIFFNYCLN